MNLLLSALLDFCDSPSILLLSFSCLYPLLYLFVPPASSLSHVLCCHKPLISWISQHAIFIFIVVPIYESVICSQTCRSLSRNLLLFSASVLSDHVKYSLHPLLPHPHQPAGSFMNTKIMVAIYRQWEISLVVKYHRSCTASHVSFYCWCTAYLCLLEKRHSMHFNINLFMAFSQLLTLWIIKINTLLEVKSSERSCLCKVIELLLIHIFLNLWVYE